MADIELVIKVSEELYNRFRHEYSDENLISKYTNDAILDAFCNGTPLPKGHRDLFDKTEILRFLKCPKYENCDWKNCFDCNESRCINLNNVNDLVPIILADREQESEE